MGKLAPCGEPQHDNKGACTKQPKYHVQTTYGGERGGINKRVCGVHVRYYRKFGAAVTITEIEVSDEEYSVSTDLIMWAAATFARTALTMYQSNAAIDGPWDRDRVAVTVRPFNAEGQVLVQVCNGMLSATCLWPTRAADHSPLSWVWDVDTRTATTT